MAWEIMQFQEMKSCESGLQVYLSHLYGIKVIPWNFVGAKRFF